MKKFFCSALLLMGLMSLPGSVRAAEVSGDAYAGLVTRYLWRGQQLHKNPAFQPGADISYKGFSLGYWGSININHTDQTDPRIDHDVTLAESDFTLGYSFALSETVDMSAGYTFYMFPRPSYSDSHEIFVGAVYKSLISPGVKVYYDFDDGDGVYIDLSATYGTTLASYLLSLTANMGINLGQWGYSKSLSVFSLNAAYAIVLGDRLELSPNLFVQFALNDQYRHPHSVFDGFAGLTTKYTF